MGGWSKQFVLARKKPPVRSRLPVDFINLSAAPTTMDGQPIARDTFGWPMWLRNRPVGLENRPAGPQNKPAGYLV